MPDAEAVILGAVIGAFLGLAPAVFVAWWEHHARSFDEVDAPDLSAMLAQRRTSTHRHRVPHTPSKRTARASWATAMTRVGLRDRVGAGAGHVSLPESKGGGLSFVNKSAGSLSPVDGGRTRRRPARPGR